MLLWAPSRQSRGKVDRMREVMRAARPGPQLVRVAALLGHDAVIRVRSHWSVWLWIVE